MADVVGWPRSGQVESPASTGMHAMTSYGPTFDVEPNPLSFSSGTVVRTPQVKSSPKTEVLSRAQLVETQESEKNTLEVHIRPSYAPNFSTHKAGGSKDIKIHHQAMLPIPNLPILLAILTPFAQAATATSPTAPTVLPIPPPIPTPTLFANTIVPIPSPLATPSFEVDSVFIAQHIIFLFPNLNALLPRAAAATFCLEQCVQYEPQPPANGTANETADGTGNATAHPCLSFNVNLGRPFPPGDGEADPGLRWYCSGYDAFLSAELFVRRDVEGSFLHPVGVNRVFGGGGYRDY
ncbi:MAG: hypothetical protein L6R36_005132 [Xanthoria steineri]|nr:MAG: hypothetical protein L6R36_005132 [Xanthoria steineri]